MKNIRRALAAFLFALWLPALAMAGTSTITVKDSTGATQTYDVITDGSGHFVSMTGLCDGVAAANCATINSSKQLLVLAAQSGAPWTISGTITGTGTFVTQANPAPVTSGGLSVFFLQPTASDNHAVIKNGAGQIYHIKATNNSATINYLRLYNAGTGFNGCNSATNLVDQWAIPSSTAGAGFVEDIALGEAFATGISICVTSGYATNDTTSATASAMSVSIGYK